MSINERFDTIIQSLYNGNKRAFALAAGVSPTVIENVVGARKGKPSFDVIERICANAHISPLWIILEKGNMVLDLDDVPSISPDKSVVELLQPFMNMLNDKDKKITTQAEEIGTLRERVRQLEDHIKKTASDAANSRIASAG